MARPLRIEFEGAFYHITARGNERRAIFKSEGDYSRFLKLLERVHDRYSVLIHAYVLMTNHYHLLIETPHGNLISTLHDLNTAYTNYFNRKYKRVGHLFQGRYRNIIVDKDSYLLELSRYVHLNPVRAGIVQFSEEYPWSSYRAYLSSKTSPSWLCTEEVLAQLDENKDKARRKYRQFVKEGLKGETENPFKAMIAGMVIGGEKFLEKIKVCFQKIKEDREIPALRTVRRRTNIDDILNRVAAFYNVPKEVVTQKRRPSHPATQVALYLVRKRTDLNLNEISEIFGKRHYTAVSVAYRRVEERGRRDSKFHQELNTIEKEIAS